MLLRASAPRRLMSASRRGSARCLYLALLLGERISHRLRIASRVIRSSSDSTCSSTWASNRLPFGAISTNKSSEVSVDPGLMGVGIDAKGAEPEGLRFCFGLLFVACTAHGSSPQKMQSAWMLKILAAFCAIGWPFVVLSYTRYGSHVKPLLYRDPGRFDLRLAFFAHLSVDANAAAVHVAGCVHASADGNE